LVRVEDVGRALEDFRHRERHVDVDRTFQREYFELPLDLRGHAEIAGGDSTWSTQTVAVFILTIVPVDVI
jgi:hypothetical protein